MTNSPAPNTPPPVNSPASNSNSPPPVNSPNTNPNSPVNSPNTQNPPSSNTPNSPAGDLSNTPNSPLAGSVDASPGTTTNDGSKTSIITTVPIMPLPIPRSNGDGDTNDPLIIGLVSTAAAILAAVLLLVAYKRRKKKTWPTAEDGNIPKPNMPPLAASRNIVSDSPTTIEIALDESPLAPPPMPVAINPLLTRVGSDKSSKVGSPVAINSLLTRAGSTATSATSARSDTSVPLLPVIGPDNLRRIDAEKSVRVEGGVAGIVGAAGVGGMSKLRRGESEDVVVAGNITEQSYFTAPEPSFITAQEMTLERGDVSQEASKGTPGWIDSLIGGLVNNSNQEDVSLGDF